MTVNDVDLVTQPTAHLLKFAIHPSVANSRLTFQHFIDQDAVLAFTAPHNSDARQSDSDEWPPPLLFDVAYGCPALKTWGVIGFVEFVRKHTRGIYYAGGSEQIESDEQPDEVHNRKAAKQKKTRNVSQLARNT